MDLSRFPTDVLSILTSFITLTDLILLHACGDGLFNSKMKTSPITIRLTTARCKEYYKHECLSRFGPVVNIVHIITDDWYGPEFIPPTTKYVFTSETINCYVPGSVESLTACTIGNSADFVRKPSELEVTVHRLAYFSGEAYKISVKYVTRLLDHREYSKEMINLKEIVLPDDGRPWSEAIPGVVVLRKQIVCNHNELEYDYIEPGNMWFMGTCVSCRQVTRVETKGGTVCHPMPDYTNLIIRNLNYDRIVTFLSRTTKNFETVDVRLNVPTMNDFCKNCLGMLPPSVKSIRIELIAEESGKKQPSFVGIKKRYPFLINVYCSSRFLIEIDDFTGIDSCNSDMLIGYDIAEVLGFYPRLSVTYD